MNLTLQPYVLDMEGVSTTLKLSWPLRNQCLVLSLPCVAIHTRCSGLLIQVANDCSIMSRLSLSLIQLVFGIRDRMKQFLDKPRRQSVSQLHTPSVLRAKLISEDYLIVSAVRAESRQHALLD